MGHKLAIDFGTTNSVVARWDDASGAIEIVAIPGLDANQADERWMLIPSLLYVHDGRSGRVSIGQAVLDRQLDRQRNNRLFRNFKRSINAGPGVEPRLIDGAPWTDHDAGQHFLRRLIESIPYPTNEIEQLMLTVPVAAFEGYAAWLGKAMQAFPADKIRIVDESTAAALGYAITQPDAIVLVLDFGGGTLDLSLVRLPESREKTGGVLRALGLEGRSNTAQVLAKAGVTLGGSDIDQWVLAHVLQRAGLSIHDLGQSYPALLSACEQAKIALSTFEATTVDVQLDGGPARTVPLTRRDMETLMEQHGFYSALYQAVDKVMSAAHRRGIFKEDVSQVLLVGGTALVPSIQQILKLYFLDKPVRVDKPFTAIAEGALHVAAGLGLEDHLAHSYGLRYLDPKSGQHQYDEIIPMGSRYPTPKPVTVLLSAAHHKQKEIEFVIGQIDTDAVSMVEVKYEDGQAVFVAQADRSSHKIVPLNAAGSAPTRVRLAPSGTPGQDRLRAEFSVDEQRRLRLAVFDLQAKKKLIEDVVVVTLGQDEANAAAQSGITGREPHLSSYTSPGQYRLSLRGLATMLNLLPPGSVSLEAVVEALRSTDAIVRYSAAEILSKRGDRDARRVIQDVLAHSPAPVRASVTQHLYRFSWFVAEPLLRQALQDADARVRESAIVALCKVRAREAYQLVMQVLPDGDDAMRMAAVWGVGTNRPDARAVPVLELALQAQDPKVREAALESLGATRAPDAMPIVRRAITDDADLKVKYAAALSLVELAEDGCFAELAGIIERTRGWERYWIVRGFSHAANYMQIDVAKSQAAEAVIGALETALRDDLSETRIAAAMALACIRHERAAAVLQSGYHREQSGETRAHMLSYAVNLMSPAGEALLRDALESQDEIVRETADYLAHSHYARYIEE